MVDTKQMPMVSFQGKNYLMVTDSTFPAIHVGSFIFVYKVDGFVKIDDEYGECLYLDKTAVMREYLVEREEHYTPRWVWILAGLSVFFFWPGLLVLFVRETNYYSEKYIEITCDYRLSGRVTT